MFYSVAGQGWANIKTQLGRKSELKRQASISPVKKLTGYKYSRSPNSFSSFSKYECFIFSTHLERKYG